MAKYDLANTPGLLGYVCAGMPIGKSTKDSINKGKIIPTSLDLWKQVCQVNRYL